ncbi:MAG TPA: lipopolysaccharide biosynthesis protein [Thermoguttaceae bacterium]|nr:lipopolysaccharide biosynthesis protein [Thermoguttaceae bacterium]
MTTTLSPPVAKQKAPFLPNLPSPKKVLGNQVVQGVATLTVGSAAAHLMAAVAAPALTRLYTPDDFGVLAAFTALVGLLTTVGCLGYERAIPLPTKETEAISLVSLCGLILLLMTALLLMGILCFRPMFVYEGGAGGLEKYIWLVAPACFFISLYEALTYYAARTKAFTRLAWTKIYQGAGMIGCQLGWGLTRGGPLGLLVGDLAGRALGINWLGRPIVAQIAAFPSTVSFRSLWKVAKRFWRFPVLTLSSTLLNRTASHLPKLIMAGVFPPAILGHLMLADWVLHVPTSLLGQNLARVYIGEFSERRRNSPQTCRSFFLKFIFWLAVLASGPMLAIYFLSPVIFKFIFGNNWETAGQFARMLAPAILLQFVVSPVSTTLFLSERQELQLVWDTFYSISVCGSVAIAAALHWEPAAIVGIYAAAEAIAYLTQGVLLMETMRGRLLGTRPSIDLNVRNNIKG